jgi:cysteinyl-tRNA synthetase
MAVRLYNTLSRTIEPLTFRKSGENFNVYCCGPTVYGPAHIGNFRTFVLQDVLRRVLEVDGLKPFWVRNLTDVDDKTIRGAQQEGVSLQEFTQKWTERFHHDCDQLNLLRPHKEPLATEHIAMQINIIQGLLDKGYAYAAEDGIYFKVSAFENYGKLSRIEAKSLLSEGLERHSQDEYGRESVRDFALWKSYKPTDGDVYWESPWGRGRPGWHIECTAMSIQHLGGNIDLHGGGIDLCFPHHENEIAQSEAFLGEPWVRHWFHVAHLMVNGEKMSKSLGNLWTLEDIVNKGYSVAALRYLLISGHYHQTLNFTFEGLSAAEKAVAKLERFVEEKLGRERFIDDPKTSQKVPELPEKWQFFGDSWDSLTNDLNTPEALGLLFKKIASINDLTPSERDTCVEELRVVLYGFGIKLFDKKALVIPQEVQLLAEKRWQAKKDRKFDESDRLRKELLALGWNVLDQKDGYQLEKQK